jgi:pimeloyl-ACP methyl ester carboxylesterase
VVASLSQGGAWALQLAAEYADRVLGSALIGPSLAITEGHAVRGAAGDPEDLPPSRVPFVERDPVEHWAKYDPAYWRDHHEDFLWFFFGMCFPEPHSTKQIEDCVGWGLDTTPDVLAAEACGSRPDRETVERWCRAVSSPVLTIHGNQDLISPSARAQRVAELTGGECVLLEGAGHLPLARDPVKVNLLIRDFARRCGTGQVAARPDATR